MSANSKYTNRQDFGSALSKHGVASDGQRQAQESFEGKTLADRQSQPQFYPEQDLEAFRSADGKLRLYRVTSDAGKPGESEGSYQVPEREYVRSLRKDGSFDEAKFRSNTALTENFQRGRLTHVHVREFSEDQKPRGHVGYAGRQEDSKRSYAGGGQQVRLTEVPQAKLTSFRIGSPDCSAMGRDAQKRQADLSDQQIQIRRLKARSESQAAARSRTEAKNPSRERTPPRSQQR